MHLDFYLNLLCTDMDEVYHLLSNMVKDTGAENYLLSMLQHLLLIRNDYYIRPQYYKVIEECVSQVVLHRSGMDPDFAYRGRLDIDLTHLVDMCVDKAKVEASEQKASDFSKKVKLLIISPDNWYSVNTSLSKYFFLSSETGY
ncbi:UNVERIFIED_CONTAM: hypothetical protein FKN15_066994 [Acipenser sinensis]